jgi:putative iron-regulated protein
LIKNKELKSHINLKFMKIKYSILLSFGFFFVSCKDKDEPINTEEADRKAVIENYANLVYANYQDALIDAIDLRASISDFVLNPSEQGLINAKGAWKTARESYGQTEAFRFANGPIDDFDGPEGLLNAWPLDENYIDYVEGNSNSGIINDIENFPDISIELLDSLNESGGEKNISVGYHAIEFLLWGQDLTTPSEKKAGLRPYTDYTTLKNADRRVAYLSFCANQLVDKLSELVEEWKPNGNYRTTLLAQNSNESLKVILQSIGILAASELGGERVLAAYNAKDQEEEHSCFSDNTHRDVILNVQGVKNVFTGIYIPNHYHSIIGKSIADLLKAKDETLYNNVMAQLNTSLQSAQDIPAPFDFAISDTDSRVKVLDTYSQLQDLGDDFVLVGQKLGLQISTDLPE